MGDENRQLPKPVPWGRADAIPTGDASRPRKTAKTGSNSSPKKSRKKPVRTLCRAGKMPPPFVTKQIEPQRDRPQNSARGIGVPIINNVRERRCDTNKPHADASTDRLCRPSGTTPVRCEDVV